MKKLVSICFFSIMFLVLSVQAQDCCPFRLNSSNGAILTDIANVPGGTLKVDHRLIPWAVPGRTDVYDMIFSDADCLGIDYETGKVSLEWELWCDGHQVTNDLSDYCTLSFQTRYNELQWIGGAVAEGTPTTQDYPGAIQQYQGTYNISNIAFDYFYFQFLANTQNRILITWNQAIRNVMLVVRVRERLNGTNNELYWNEDQNLNLGGHQSMPGRIIAADTMTTESFFVAERDIYSCEPVTKGRPAFTMEETGTYKIVWYSSDCITLIDSVITYNFTLYDHPSDPEVDDQTYCQFATADTIRLAPETKTSLLDHVNEIVAYWSVDGGANYFKSAFFVPRTETVGTETIYVKRVDERTGCESEPTTFDITVNPLPDTPVVPAADRITEYCVGSEAATLSYTAPAGEQVLWGNTSDNITSLVAPTPTTATAGTQVYYLKLQNIETECISSNYDSMIVKVFANPVVTITSDKDTLCQGEEANLKANPTNFYSYKWYINIAGDISEAGIDTVLTFTNNLTATGDVYFGVKVKEAHDLVKCEAKANIYKIYAYETIGAPTAVRGDTALCGAGTTTLTVNNASNATTSVWYDAKDANANVLATGTSYTAEFTTTDTVYVSSKNAHGCETPVEDWIAIAVTVNSIPQITITPDDNGEVCAENELIIRSTVTDFAIPITYSWSGDGLQGLTYLRTVKFKKDVAGTYPITLYVKDNNNCENRDTTYITVNALPVIVKDVDYVISDNEYCVGTNASIEFTTTYDYYSIYNPEDWKTTKTFSKLPVGTYYLRVKDSKGCVSHKNTETIEFKPATIEVTADVEGNENCSIIKSGKITVNVTPAAVYTYALSGQAEKPAQFSNVFDKLDSGTYVITVFDTTTKCQQTKTVYVEDERATITFTATSNHDNTHCERPYDGAITISNTLPASESGYRYSVRCSDWGYSVTTESTQIDTLKHGSYTITAMDKGTYCMAQGSVSVSAAIDLPQATIVARENYCYGDTATMSIVTAGDVKFQNWTYMGPSASDTMLIKSIKYQTKFSLSGFTAGDHIFTAHIIDTVTHCDNTVSDTVRVIPVNIDLIPVYSSVCSGDSTKVICAYFPDEPTQDTLVSYYWQSSSPWHYVAPSVYDTIFVTPQFDRTRVTIKVTDNHGCTNSSFVYIGVNELPNIVLTGAKDYCQDENTNITVSTSHSGPSYVWKKNGTQISTSATLTTAVGSADFDLNVEVTDDKGCKNDSTFTVNVITNPGAPVFDPSTQYFCVNTDIYVSTSSQEEPSPAGQEFKWESGDPNTLKVAGTYSAHWEVTENSVTCKSDSKSVTVVVEPASFTADITYGSSFTPSTSYERCYEDSPSDKIYVDVDPNPSTTTPNKYTMWKNGVKLYDDVTYWLEDFEMDITRTAVGTYTDTIIIKLDQTKPDDTHCYAYDTLYYTLTINPLPTTPSDFPTYMVDGYPSIFYCNGSELTYTFTAPAGGKVEYSTEYLSSGLHIVWYDDPRDADDWKLLSHYMVARFTDAKGCVKKYDYNTVKVSAPTSVSITADVDDNICGTPFTTANFVAEVTSSEIGKSYNTIRFNWGIERDVNKENGIDTLYKTFSSTTTVGVSTSVIAGLGDQYQAECGYKSASKTITFEPIPSTPVFKSTTAGYVDAHNAGYCSYETIDIDENDFTVDAGTTTVILNSSRVKISSITSDGVYYIYSEGSGVKKCPSEELTLTVTKYRELSQPDGFVSEIAYCSDSIPVYTFTAHESNDSLAYYRRPSTYLTSAPDTAGAYNVKVVDKEHKQCYKDNNFDIYEVKTPIVTVSIYGDSLRNICEGEEVGILLAVPSTLSYSNAFYWNGDNSEGQHFQKKIETISADSTITVKLITTHTEHSISCPSSPAYDTVVVKYYAKPDGPSYIGDKDFCEGDTVKVQTSSFTPSYAAGISLSLKANGTPATMPYYCTDTKNLIVYSYYDSLPTCKSADSSYTITKHELPNVEISGTSPICYADSTILTASGAVSYVWSNGDTLSTTKVPAGFYEVTGTDAYQCSNTDTMTVKSWDKFTVTVTEDTVICVGECVDMTATPSPSGTYTYAWYKDGAPFATTKDINDCLSVASEFEHGMSVPYVYSVAVTDEHGCVSPADSNEVNVTASNRAYFTFTPSRDLTSRVGESTNFGMMIDKNCWDPYEQVYIDFQFYKDGQLLSDQQLSQCLATNSAMEEDIYNTKYEIDIRTNAPGLSSYNARSLNFGTASEYLPHSELLTSRSETYNWFYLHFLDNRQIAVNFGDWLQAGTYTVTYAIVKADITKAGGTVIPVPYNTGLYVGGTAGHYYPKDTIALDMVTIVVDAASADDAPTSIATLEENKEEMNMTVYPNPADNNVNVVLNGVQGQTVITIHDMSGKAISSRRVNVDFDGQLYNLPVEGYAQGIYFIKVVNGDAVMTKKLIIAR